MTKITCCHNCVYSYCDHEHALWSMSVGVLTWPACANHPESCGRMQRVPERGICANYRPRLAKPEGEVRQIPLGNGFYAYVDAADYEWLSRWTWHLHAGYAMRLEKRKQIYMHREIMQPPDGMIVDHKNRNKLDNTRINLRACTHAENARNRGKRRGTSSQFRGVSRHGNYHKYYAAVYYEGEQIFLGLFTDEIEAARAVDRKAVEVFGESAQLNFPQEWPPERRAEVYAQRDAVRREGKTGGRLRPPGMRQKRRAMSARPRATRGGGRDRARVRRQKVKGRHGRPEAGRTTRDTGRAGGAKRQRL